MERHEYLKLRCLGTRKGENRKEKRGEVRRGE
jgi:hypothetical protein